MFLWVINEERKLAQWEGWNRTGRKKRQNFGQKLRVLSVCHAIEPLEAKFWVPILIYQSIFLIFLIKIPTKMFRALNVLVRRYFLGHKMKSIWRAETGSMGRGKPDRTENTQNFGQMLRVVGPSEAKFLAPVIANSAAAMADSHPGPAPACESHQQQIEIRKYINPQHPWTRTLNTSSC